MRSLSNIDWSSQGWARVWGTTIAGTLVCIAVALYVDSFNFMTLDGPERLRAIATNIVLPMVLAMPLLFFFSAKLRELAIARQKLELIASTDSLTAVLNRGAFTMLVDAWLTAARTHASQRQGALLVIDADHFKEINDTYGHDRGDVALLLIANSIKNVLRGADIVGRIGGEEFGVFLPGADPAEARTVAERIRKTVHDADFVPDGVRRQITVSVGGALFAHQVGFTELYKVADESLYAAKGAGRDRVNFRVMRRFEAEAALI